MAPKGSARMLKHSKEVNGNQKTQKSTIVLISLAVLPVIIMLVTTGFSSLVAFFPDLLRRDPYRFSWEDALDERINLSPKYNQLPYIPMDVPRLSNLSLAEFRDLWDSKWPVVITDVVPKWNAYKWTKEFLYKYYQNSKLTVIKNEGSLSESFGLIQTLGEFYKQTFRKANSTSWLYIADEHFITSNPSLSLDIGANVYASEDYFEYFDEELRPKNAMLLWGTAHSRSKLHVDPYNWTGTLAVIKGSKRWKLFAPGSDIMISLKRQRSGFPLDCSQLVSPIDSFADDVPCVKHVMRPLEFQQNAGELLIIPTGWAHQAYNSEETIAISSQYMNRYNYKAVLEEIIECTNINDQLPLEFDDMSASDQIRTVMSLVPQDLKSKANDINNHMKSVLMTDS